VNQPPAALRPTTTRARGQRVEVRNFDGELVRTVSVETAEKLLQPGPLGCPIAERSGDHIRLKLGIRYISPRDAKRPSGQPNLTEMQRREPERYADNWRGSSNPHIGRGAIGKITVDRQVFTGGRPRSTPNESRR
jgi:hypothetical protein